MKELYQALLAAKLEFKPIIKNKRNPHFKNEYADLDTILAAVEPSLHKYGLIVIQPLDGHNVITRIIHVVTAQEISSRYPLPEGLDSQKFGAAISYARRYDLCSILNITAETDDDGNAASGVGQQKQSATPEPSHGYKPMYGKR